MRRFVVHALALVAIAAPSGLKLAADATQAGTVAGTVVDAQSAGRPVTRAWVTLRDEDQGVGRTTLADDEGRFSFTGLPPGRYVLAASKAAYVTTEYGARVPGRAGTPIAMEADGRGEDLVLVMPRGGVLEGTLRDTAGEPASGLPLALLEWKFERGRRRLVENRNVTVLRERVVTDDRGMFRFFGLPPGDYVIAAEPPRTGRTTLRSMTDEDIGRAERLLSGQTDTTGRAIAPPPGRGGARGRGATLSYARVYYPGTAAPGDALPVSLGLSEERTGLDFGLALVPAMPLTVTLAGLPPGAGETSTLSVTLQDVASGRSSGRGGRGGTLTFPNVAPGRYRVSARYYERTPDARIDPDGDRYWAVQPITVTGTTPPPVTLTLEPDIAIATTVTFEGSPDTPRPARTTVWMRPDPDTEDTGVRETTAVPDDAGGSRLRAPPGRYYLSVQMFENDGRPSTQWALDTLTADGAELAADTLTIAPGAAPRLSVVLTDRPTVLTGVMQNAGGQPAPDYFVVAFSPDRDRWTWQSRAIQAVRPDTDGRFVIRGMPPGDYLLAAMTSLDDGEWYDPALLEQLAAAAVPVALSAGATTTQDIRVR